MAAVSLSDAGASTQGARIDVINMALIGVACLLSHAFPYGMLLLSYAVLGPAHYLTQISWLHDRRYFSGTRLVLPVMGLIILLFSLPALAPGLMHPWFQALLVGLALWFALMLTVPRNPVSLGVGFAAGAVTVYMMIRFPGAALFVSVLLPTVLHVFVFTASFMLVGALRTRSREAYASVIILLLCAASFLLPLDPLGRETAVPHMAGLQFFQPVVDFLKGMGLSTSTNAQLFGFLSFAYTYHYANWFSKVKAIQWNRVPRGRMRGMVVAYATMFALYAHDFTAGFFLSALLSNLHVFLEFPLNLRTFATLGRWTLIPKSR